MDPVLRNGHTLTLSSAMTSSLGLAYWALAARRYDTATVGRNSAAISTMMFLSGLAQLNLMSSLTKFVPTAGRHTRRLVGFAYLSSICIALIVATLFLTVVRRVSPSLGFLVDSPVLAVWFVLSTMGWTIFVLQDSILTALRRSWLVPVENAAFALAKVGLVVAFAASAPRVGILTSWTLAMIISLVPTNAYLFRRAIPNHQRAAGVGNNLPAAASIIQFAATDYVGAMFWLTATALMPLLVVDIAGARATAYFSLAWVMAYALYLISSNMGISLVVETSGDQSELARTCRRMVIHVLKLLTPVVLALVLAAPFVLRVFGPEYSGQGTLLLRLLALSALPNVVTAAAVSAGRAQRRAGVAVVVLGALCLLVFALSTVLLEMIGIAGVGLAWLVTQSLIAAALLIKRDWWLPPSGAASIRRRRIHAADRARRIASVVQLPRIAGPVRRGLEARDCRALIAELVPSVTAATRAAGLALPAEWIVCRIVPTVSEVTVAMLASPGSGAVAVLKVARGPEGRQDLRAHRRVLTALHDDERLGEWRRLLPVVLAHADVPEAAFSVETVIAGVNASTLMAHNDGTDRVMLSALSVMAELHRRSARTIVIDESLLEAWVDQPLETVLSLYPRNGDYQVRAIERLRGELRAALSGRQTILGWTHGDLTPGNLIMDEDGRRVQGIVDWGNGSPDGFLDSAVCMFLMTAVAGSQRSELGPVVRRSLRRPEWPAWEQRLFDESGTPEPTTDYRPLVLLSWATHVANNVRKAERYRRHPLWRAVNVDPILAEVLQ
jgi:O-antigen/teichoic acid export membrane protein